MFSNQDKTKNGLETVSHFQLATIVNHSAAVTFKDTRAEFAISTSNNETVKTSCNDHQQSLPKKPLFSNVRIHKKLSEFWFTYIFFFFNVALKVKQIRLSEL